MPGKTNVELAVHEVIAQVADLIKENHPDPKPDEVAIHCWGQLEEAKPVDLFGPRHELTGLRVAEVSLMWNRKGGGISGASYMQTDLPHGLAACAEAERVVCATLDGWPEEELREEKWRLLYCICGPEVADEWQEREEAQ